MIDRQVSVKRNIVEQTLMNVKDYILAHQSIVVKISIVSGIVLFVIIAGIVFFDHKINKETSDFEAVLEEYRNTYTLDESQKQEKFKRTVNKLGSIVDSSYFGYVHKNGYYIIASLYFNEKDYSNAVKYYEKAYHYCSPLFAALALQQAGIACEYINNIDEALRYYLLCESKYNDAYNSDQILFNIGRMYSLKGEYFKAREYFTKVTVEFPQSVFAKRAIQYGMFLGAIESGQK